MTEATLDEATGQEQQTAAVARPLRHTTRNMSAPSGSPSLSGRFRTWAVAADEGETQWAVRRSPVAQVACWSLVVVLLAGGFIARAHLGPEPTTWVLLTAANTLALALAVGGLRQARLPPVMFAGILGVFLLGGVFQVYLLSYNYLSHPNFINDQVPLLSWITSSDISRVYGLITLAFVIFCLMVSVLAAVPLRSPIPRSSSITDFRPLSTLLVWATVGYVGFTVLQVTLGFGQSALYNRALPFRVVAITLFYRRDLYPALLLLGIWAYDRRKTKLSYRCVIATGMVAVSASYVSTSRGTAIIFGLPILFLWLLTGRFTKLRKAMVVAVFVMYLAAAPVLSGLRATRVQAATGAARSANAVVSPPPLSAESLNYEVGHVVFRAGGAGSLLFSARQPGQLSVGGLWRVFRPSGLTSYFTYEVVGIPVSATIASSQAPTVIGLGMLVGGPQGMVLVLVLVVLGLDLASRWIARTLWSWPVALALLAYAAVAYFSEGVTIQFYKSMLAIAVTEVVYRRVAPPPTPRVESEPRGLPAAVSGNAAG